MDEGIKIMLAQVFMLFPLQDRAKAHRTGNVVVVIELVSARPAHLYAIRIISNRNEI